MGYETIKDRLVHSEFFGFVVLNNHQETNLNFQQILKELFSSNYFTREWTYIILQALDWIHSYNFFISRRNPNYPLLRISAKECDDYAAILGTSINPESPPNSYIVLEVTKKDGIKNVDPYGGKVINHTQYPIERVNAPDPFKQIYAFKNEVVESATNLFIRWSNICTQWLNNTDGEFILDPDYYSE